MIYDAQRAREAERAALDAILGADPIGRARALARESLFGLAALCERALERGEDPKLRRVLALIKRAERLVRE